MGRKLDGGDGIAGVYAASPNQQSIPLEVKGPEPCGNGTAYSRRPVEPCAASWRRGVPLATPARTKRGRAG